MSILVTIETGDMAQIFANPIKKADSIGSNDISSPSPWILTSLLILPILLILFFPRSLVFLGARETWMQVVWGLVLDRSLFGRLILRIPSRQGLGWRKIVSKIPNNQRLGLGYGTVSGRLSCWQCWSIFLRKEGGWKLVYVSALIAFSTSSSQLSFSGLRCSIWGLIKGLSLSWKYQMRTDSFRALSISYQSQ